MMLVRHKPRVNEIELCAWLSQAEPGDALEYHRGFLVLDILLWLKMKDWAAGWDWMKNEDGTYWLRPHIFSLYSTVFMFLIGVPIGRASYKRLFVNNKPPERDLEKESEIEEEE